jgi:hypothetical protein
MMQFIVTLTTGLMLASLVGGQTVDQDNSIERAFVDGGSVRFRLSSGEYAIKAGNTNRIFVRWRNEDSSDLKDLQKIKIDVSVSGSDALIRTEGPTKHVKTIIEVPMHSDLYLRMRAGDVRVSGIEGNKNIHLTAGDLKIDVQPESYSYVRGAVTFGDLNAGPLGISKDGIKSSFEWHGGGKYKLDASLFAGDLNLVAPTLRQ